FGDKVMVEVHLCSRIKETNHEGTRMPPANVEGKRDSCIRVNSCEFVAKNQLLTRGKLAAATACPTRLLFSSGKWSEIFCASSGKSACNTSFAFRMMKSPPMPEVTRPSTSRCRKS